MESQKTDHGITHAPKDVPNWQDYVVEAVKFAAAYNVMCVTKDHLMALADWTIPRRARFLYWTALATAPITHRLTMWVGGAAHK